jgi:predicted alpha/beta hydrolase
MNNAQIMQAAAAIQDEYAEFAAEQRACGYEVISFEEFTGQSSPRAEADARYQRLMDNDELDLY